MQLNKPGERLRPGRLSPVQKGIFDIIFINKNILELENAITSSVI